MSWKNWNHWIRWGVISIIIYIVLIILFFSIEFIKPADYCTIGGPFCIKTSGLPAIPGVILMDLLNLPSSDILAYIYSGILFTITLEIISWIVEKIRKK